jgi:hypothetical protein
MNKTLYAILFVVVGFVSLGQACGPSFFAPVMPISNNNLDHKLKIEKFPRSEQGCITLSPSHFVNNQVKKQPAIITKKTQTLQSSKK